MLVYFVYSRTRSPRLSNTFALIVPIATEKFSRIRWNISYLESVEEYSEGKIHMSEPESGKGNVNTVYFVNQARGILESVAHGQVLFYTMNEHAIANVYLHLSPLLRIMFVKIILLQISFCA